MTVDVPDAVIYALGFLVWLGAVLIAIRQKRELGPMALMLIIMGILGGGLLGQMGFRAPGAWAFMVIGLVLMALMTLRIPREG